MRFLHGSKKPLLFRYDETMRLPLQHEPFKQQLVLLQENCDTSLLWATTLFFSLTFLPISTDRRQQCYFNSIQREGKTLTYYAIPLNLVAAFAVCHDPSLSEVSVSFVSAILFAPSVTYLPPFCPLCSLHYLLLFAPSVSYLPSFLISPPSPFLTFLLFTPRSLPSFFLPPLFLTFLLFAPSVP